VLSPSTLPRALAVVTAVVAGAFGPLLVGSTLAGPHLASRAEAAAPSDPSQPLSVHMRSITPDYVPDHGPIVIRGTVTNTTADEWTAINVEGFIGSAPITSTADLAVAAQTPVSADVGHRITTPGTFDHIDKLEPGQSAHFRVHLPRSQLPVSAPGVYWFGVHALGGTANGRSPSAAGRDRTFLPLVPHSLVAKGSHVDTALVVPVRAEVTRDSSGAVEDVPGWMSSLRDGPLHSVVALGRAAHGRPLTWLVDPAVPDTVRALAHGNPVRTLTYPDESASGGPSKSPAPSDGASATGAGTTTAGPTAATSRVARRWLRHLHRVLADGSGEILGLPYGDLEVGSAARYDRPYLKALFERTGDTLRPWKLPLGSSVVAPPTGRLSAAVTTAIPRQTRVLLDARGLTGSAPPVGTLNGRRVIVASSGAAQGGPGPVAPLSPLALRQRILSEAALRLLDGAQPLVVELPSPWRQRVPTSFFSGLDVPWLRLTTLDDATAGAATPLRAARLRQPPTIPSLGPEFYSLVNRVLTEARTLQSVLSGNHVLRRHIVDETASNSSYSASGDRFGALTRVRSTASWLARNLAGVTMAAPQSVTLASTSGRFSALVSNDLDVPVTVEVRAVTDSGLTITGGNDVVLPPHGRSTVLLNASTHEPGVHTVTLELTDKQGTAFGSGDPFPMRAVQVSALIWVIIGAGVALLFGAIIVRLVRRVWRSRA
jgi:hypothetical protein